ncbi:MAG: Lrp/AsnC family transcriptional regulator [Nitrospinota bacterium]
MEAYVHIRTKLGQSAKVAREVGNLPGVKSAKVVAGRYDIVALVEGPDMAALGRLVLSSIQTIGGVTSTETSPIIESKELQ